MNVDELLFVNGNINITHIEGNASFCCTFALDGDNFTNFIGGISDLILRQISQEGLKSVPINVQLLYEIHHKDSFPPEELPF